MSTNQRLPLPVASAFVICNDVWRDERTGVYLLVAPITHVPLAEFPANVRLSIYVHLTGGHGQYRLNLMLRNSDDKPVWQWSPSQPLTHDDPLVPHQVTFNDLVLAVPALGKYTLALQADGEDFALQGVWFGPPAAKRTGS